LHPARYLATMAAKSEDGRANKRLGDLLIEKGLATREELEPMAKLAQARRMRLGELLVEEGQVDEREIYRRLAVQAGCRLYSVGDLIPLVTAGLANRVSPQYIKFHRIVPLRLENAVLTVASSEFMLDLPELLAAYKADSLDVRLVTPTDLRRLQLATELDLLVPDDGTETEKKQEADLLRPTDAQEAVVSHFDSMLLEAIAERASDIHIEVYEQQVRLRMRVDGELRDVPRYKILYPQLLSLINVIKIRARLDIAEHRIPQGGRFTTAAGGRVYDLRVQTQPCLYGEHIVLRFLPQGKRLISIEELGFPPALTKVYRRIVESPVGLVLVVGPTGSGKSTTLYAGLQILARDISRKVITVEDPIEYAIAGIQQTQVAPEVGFTFANAMRAFVREDPDVILVGEIRDGETALEALRASQTGHLVFSTLHCNDSVDAVQRLFDLGMHPNSIASELEAVFSQRLAKRICESCRTEVEPDPRLVDEIFPHGIPADFRCFRGKGCEHCGGYGTLGRVAVVEYLQVDSYIRSVISRHTPLQELRAAALKNGLVPLRDQALRHVTEGTIALEELPSFLTVERLAPETSEPEEAKLVTTFD
jgi:type IV pilus assembly protein PilB